MKKTKFKKTTKTALPSKEEILAFIRESSTQVGKRDIARAFGLTGDAKIGLKALLKDLAVDGDPDGATDGQDIADLAEQRRIGNQPAALAPRLPGGHHAAFADLCPGV